MQYVVRQDNMPCLLGSGRHVYGISCANGICPFISHAHEIISGLSCTRVWWHISAATCLIIMLTRQIFMLSCQIFMLICHLFIC